MRHLRYESKATQTVCGLPVVKNGAATIPFVVHASKARRTDCGECRAQYRAVTVGDRKRKWVAAVAFVLVTLAVR